LNSLLVKLRASILLFLRRFLRCSPDAAEQVLIQRALNHSGGNVAEAARLRGLNRSRIYRRFPNQV
jgi:transcriptional regulator of acetoin/glycerol metabolism